jgi:hypothetical protein
MWHEVDLDDAVWELSESLVQVGATIKRKDTKSRAGTRLVYLDTETVASSAPTAACSVRTDYGSARAGWIFRSPRGAGCKPDWFTDNWATLVDIAVKRIPGLSRIPLPAARLPPHRRVCRDPAHPRL